MIGAQSGDPQEAWAKFDASASVARRYVHPWNEADAFHMWGRALLDSGDPARLPRTFEGGPVIESVISGTSYQ